MTLAFAPGHAKVYISEPCHFRGPETYAVKNVHTCSKEFFLNQTLQ